VSLHKRSGNIFPRQACGKRLQSIHVSQYEDSLDLELAFEGGLALELSFRVAYRRTVRLLQWENGNSRVLERREG